jgi:hypothetical protein
MSALAVTTRQGIRLARASRTRALLIVGTIAAATTLAMSSAVAAWGCGALTFAVLVVARRSPRPERLEHVRAWNRAGANRSAIWAAGTAEALLLGWVGTLAGAAVGVIPLVQNSTSGLDWRSAYVVAQLGWLTLAACLPTRRDRTGATSHIRAAAQITGIVGRAVLVVAALLVAFGAATTINSSIELAIGGIFILALVALAGLVVSGPLADAIVRALAREKHLRPSGAIATRHRTPGTVRLVIAAAVTTATAVAILGASIEARPETERLLDDRLAQLPVLPRNVALIRLEPTDSLAFLGGSPAFTHTEVSAELRAAVGRVVPGAEVIELRNLPVVSLKPFSSCSLVLPTNCSANLFCSSCGRPMIVAEPRLRAIYGSSATYPSLGVVNTTLNLPASSRFPPRKALLRAVLDGTPLPAASFTNAVYDEVPKEAVERSHLTARVRTLFLRSNRPLTNAELSRLASVVRTTRPPTDGQVTLIAPTGQVLPQTYLASARPPSLREQPWAATSNASRWSATIIAALLALAALLATLTIDTLDRRRDVQRLEHLGATPGQVRGGAALHAGVLLLAITSVNVIAIGLIVRNGIRAFNHNQPEIPIPFVMPSAVMTFLLIGLPLIAAALAALVARPLRVAAVDR